MSHRTARLCLLAISGLLLANPLNAAVLSAQSDQTPERAKGREDRSASRPNQRICTSDAFTGTRLRARICKTRAEWLREEGEVPGERN